MTRSDKLQWIGLGGTGEVLVITRFRYDSERATQAADELASRLRQFAERPGYVRGTVGRAAEV